jgi:hypothetical protein
LITLFHDGAVHFVNLAHHVQQVQQATCHSVA